MHSLIHRPESWHYSFQSPAFFFPVCPCCAAITTRAYDWTGNLRWTADHFGRVDAIAVDSAGNVYTAGPRANGVTFRVYDNSGVEQQALRFNETSGSDFRDMQVDADGNIFFAVFGIGVRKYAPDWSVTWQYNDTGNLVRIGVDGDSNVATNTGKKILANGTLAGSYATDAANAATMNFGGDAFLSFSSPFLGPRSDLAKFAINRSQIWTSGGATGFAVDLITGPSGEVYSVGDLNGGTAQNIRRSSGTDGSQVWSALSGMGDFVVGVAVGDSPLKVAVVGARTNSRTLEVYNASNGTLLWTADHTADLRCVAADAAGVYVAGNRVH